MKKIPTLFLRDPNGIVTPHLTPGCEWVAAGEGLTTIMIDGRCVKVERGENNALQLLKRVPPPEPYEYAPFMPCSRNDPNDRLLYTAFDRTHSLAEGVYEVYGPGINQNPLGTALTSMVRISPAEYRLTLVGSNNPIRRGPTISVGALYENLKDELGVSDIEGLVFHLETPSMMLLKAAKIKRSDFGFPWPKRQDNRQPV